MRDIKFRGKRIDNGEWVEGWLVDDMIIPKGKEYDFDYVRYTMNNVRAFEVDPSTVGQFTGLTDKNGKDIFEGDKVEYDDAYITSSESGQDWDEFINEGVVYWDEERLGWSVTNRESLDDETMIDEWNLMNVIGSVHDKELTH